MWGNISQHGSFSASIGLSSVKSPLWFRSKYSRSMPFVLSSWQSNTKAYWSLPNCVTPRYGCCDRYFSGSLLTIARKPSISNP